MGTKLEPPLAPRPCRDRLVLTGVLVVSSAAALAMLAARAWYGGTAGYSLFLWNLFLAWVPMVLAGVIWRVHRAGRKSLPVLLPLGLLWLLFLPNAPYLLTEFIHLHPSHAVHDRPLPAWLLPLTRGGAAARSDGIPL